MAELTVKFHDCASLLSREVLILGSLQYRNFLSITGNWFHKNLTSSEITMRWGQSFHRSNVKTANHFNNEAGTQFCHVIAEFGWYKIIMV